MRSTNISTNKEDLEDKIVKESERLSKIGGEM